MTERMPQRLPLGVKAASPERRTLGSPERKPSPRKLLGLDGLVGIDER